MLSKKKVNKEAIPKPVTMTIEYLNCKEYLNFELNDTISMYTPSLDLILFGKWIIFIDSTIASINGVTN